jgi:hypothetical protein
MFSSLPLQLIPIAHIQAVYEYLWQHQILLLICMQFPIFALLFLCQSLNHLIRRVRRLATPIAVEVDDLGGGRGVF